MTNLDLYRFKLHEADEAPLFTHAELACRCGCAGARLATGFADRLRELRMVFGRPMIVTSAARCAAHNAAIGGHARSLHVYDTNAHGLDGAAAIDIARRDAAYNYLLIKIAQELGWSIGVAKWGFHFDRRDLAGLPKDVFGYGG